MAYLRKPDDRKRGSKENQAPPTPKRMQMPSSPAAPHVPLGEDKASHDRHTRFLQAEFRKVNPNKQTAAVLMKRTFSLRRQMILEDPIPMEKMLCTYPALKYPEEVKKFILATSLQLYLTIGYLAPIPLPHDKLPTLFQSS